LLISKEENVARKVIETITSDLSNVTIPEGEVWTMQISHPDGRRKTYRLDISEKEAMEYGAKGVEVARRGRPKGSSNRKTNGG
jgi:hypothetical protein